MSKENFNDFCDTQILFFTFFLNKINNLRTNYNRNDFSQETQEIIEKIFELNLIFAISHLDSLVILKRLNDSRLDWEVKFFLKKLYLNIYETFVSYDSKKSSIKKILCKSKEENDEFASINRELKMFKKKYDYEYEIRQVRNKIAGHISSDDFNLYFQTLEILNPRKNIEMGTAYIFIINKINSFLYQQLKSKVKKRYCR